MRHQETRQRQTRLVARALLAPLGRRAPLQRRLPRQHLVVGNRCFAPNIEERHAFQRRDVVERAGDGRAGVIGDHEVPVLERRAHRLGAQLHRRAGDGRENRRLRRRATPLHPARRAGDERDRQLIARHRIGDAPHDAVPSEPDDQLSATAGANVALHGRWIDVGRARAEGEYPGIALHARGDVHRRGRRNAQTGDALAAHGRDFRRSRAAYVEPPIGVEQQPDRVATAERGDLGGAGPCEGEARFVASLLDGHRGQAVARGRIGGRRRRRGRRRRFRRGDETALRRREIHHDARAFHEVVDPHAVFQRQRQRQPSPRSRHTLGGPHEQRRARAQGGNVQIRRPREPQLKPRSLPNRRHRRAASEEK